MTRLLDCQGEIPHAGCEMRDLCGREQVCVDGWRCSIVPDRKPADLLDGRVWVDPFDSRVSYRLNEYGEPCALYRPPIGAYLAGAFVGLAFIALAVSFYRVGRWYGWWP